MPHAPDAFPHIVAFQYASHEPVWLLRHQRGTNALAAHSLTGRLDVTLTGPRRCIGFQLPGAPILEPCPQRRELKVSAIQCALCSRRQGFTQSFFVQNHLPENSAWREYAERETFPVYLAAYSTDLIKVGMTVGWRLEERLREQGAWAACVLWQGDGLEARRIERGVAALGFPERITLKQRLRSLATATDPSRLESLLHVAWRDAVTRPNKLLTDRETEVISLAGDYYGDPAAVNRHPDYRDLGAVRRIRGKVLFAKGSLAVIEDGQDCFIVDLWLARGWSLGGHDLIDVSESPLTQRSLF